MTEKEIKRLRELSLPIAGNVLYLELTKEFVELFCKAMEELEVSAKSENKSEEKSMLHNVTVKHEENKVLEEYWTIRGGINGNSLLRPYHELDHEPTPEEIAQFIYSNKVNYAFVEKDYRFESELPF